MGMAASARTDTELADALGQDDPARVLVTLHPSHPGFTAQVDAYLDRYGDRCMGELKLETLSLRDDPSFIVHVLRNYVDRPDLDPVALAAAERSRFDAALADVQGHLAPGKRARFRRQVAAARHAVKARERLRLLRTVAFGIVRDIVTAMGLRLWEAGLLESPRDVFYVRVDELQAIEEGRAVSVDRAAIAAARKAEFARYEALQIPNRFETVGAVYIGNSLGRKGTAPTRRRPARPADCGHCPDSAVARGSSRRPFG